MFIFFVLYHLMLSGSLGNSAWTFLGVNFGSKDFLGFGFLPSFDHAGHLNPEYSPGA